MGFQLLENLKEAGCHRTNDPKLKEAIRFVNTNGMMFFIADLFYASVFAVVLDSLYTSYIFITFACLFLIFSVGANLLGMINISRVAIPIIGSLLCTVLAFYFGKESQVHVALLIGTVFPFLVFKITEAFKIILTISIVVVCFLFLIFFNFSLGPHYEIQDPSILNLVTFLAFTLVLFAVAKNIWVLQRIRQDQEDLLVEKNSEIAKLISVLTHDIAQPLSIVIGSCNVIDKKPEKTEQFIRKINNSAATINAIISSVRDLHAVEQGKKTLDLQPVKVIKVLRETIAELGERISEKDINIELKGDFNLTVLAHEAIFKNQIITNLLSNAIKFSNSGGTITATLCEKERQKVELIIKDDGIGMASELMEKIFSSHESTTRPGTSGELGTGFGLPIVKKFIEMMGGSITVESKELKDASQEHGTVFVILLPKFAG